MKIAVDAMGGDQAPGALVEGALIAASQCGAELVLVGNERNLRPMLSEAGEGSIRIVHARDVVADEEPGPVVVRKKRDASLSVAMRLLAEGRVDAVVSAGNSSAVVAAAKHFVGLVHGLRRPAMAAPVPMLEGRVLLVDAGAHAEANTIHLAQSAALAHAYLKVTDGLDRPRIGLLNIGQEPLKGIKVVRRAFTLLSRSPLNFVGNVEPTRLFARVTDAAICDGYVGNVLLKTTEGLAEVFLGVLKPFAAEIGSDGLRRAVACLEKAYDFENVGGAPLLGVKKPVVVAHGRSGRRAISNAIRLAADLAEKKVFARMADEIEKDAALAEIRRLGTVLMLENLKSRWGFTHK